MKIVADENIPFVGEAFATLGEITLLPGRAIFKESLIGADVLLVRSITHVDSQLLAGTSVKFIATATIGTDHIDFDNLAEKGIGFSDAAGSNANSVAEYVMAALLHYSSQTGTPLEQKVLGVVGVGNIGSKVVRMAQAMGMRVLENDPPLARQTGDARFIPLDHLMDADFITLHVPLTRAGQDATFHLFDTARIARMKPGSVLINSSRGAVVDNEALLRQLEKEHLNAAILDVWENEPEVDLRLLERAHLGTPHIAGYSFDGKVNGTQMIYKAVCRYFNLPCRVDFSALMPPVPVPKIECSEVLTSDENCLHELVRSVYSISDDTRRLAEIVKLPQIERGAYFDRLRKTYPMRREFFNSYVELNQNASEKLKNKIMALGFRT